MSLTIAYSIAAAGLGVTEKKLSVIASNINNADQAGYTRKTYQQDNVTLNGVSVPVGGKVVQAAINAVLSKSLIGQSATNANAQTLSNYLGDYSESYGGTASTDSTLSSSISGLLTALQSLESTPGESSSKAQLITQAQQLAAQINAATKSLQNQRAQASHDIASTVGTINDALSTVADINRQISGIQASGGSTADLEDQRNNALQTLSQQLGIQYFTNDQNQTTIYTTGGALLLSGTHAAKLSYNDVGTVTPSTTYPGGFSGIMLNGADVTASVGGGTLGALVSLRDSTFPGEQQKLDALANALITTANGALSQGSPMPPPTSLTGSTNVSATDPISATGHWRVAVCDSSGKVQSYQDIDMSTISTVGDLVTALNGISGVSASITDGKLTIAATASGSGIALNPMDSSIGGTNASQYFGFNTLFKGTDASSIAISDNLSKNNNALPTGSLSNSSTLAVGDRGLSSGDGSVAGALLDAMNATHSFAAAGNFSTRTSSIADYASSIIASAATQAKSASDNAATAQTSYDYISKKLGDLTGVNVDEETANMTSLQSSYAANAQLIATVRDMFQTLLQAVQG